MANRQIVLFSISVTVYRLLRKFGLVCMHSYFLAKTVMTDSWIDFYHIVTEQAEYSGELVLASTTDDLATQESYPIGNKR